MNAAVAVDVPHVFMSYFPINYRAVDYLYGLKGQRSRNKRKRFARVITL